MTFSFKSGLTRFSVLRHQMTRGVYAAFFWLLRIIGVRLYRYLRWLVWMGGALAAILLVALLVLRYTILPNIDDYRVDIERMASRAMGLQVRIADVDADWHGLRPGVVLKQVEVLDRNQRLALKLPEISARLSLNSLLALGVRLSSLEINGADLEVRRDAQGQITVAGIVVNAGGADDRTAQWILQQHRIVVRNARVRWNDELRQAPELPLEQLNFVLENQGRHHRFGLQATPPAGLAERFDLRGDFLHGLLARRIADYRQWDGTLYANLVVHDLTAGKRYLDYPLALNRGRGAIRAWLDFDAMTVRRLTADVALDQVVTRLRRDLSLLGLQHMQGRLKLGYDKDSYQIELRHFDLQTADGLTLKSFDLQHRFQWPTAQRMERGELALNVLELQTLASLAEHVPLPAAFHKLLRSFDPRGELTRVKFEWQGALLGDVRTQIRAQIPGAGHPPEILASETSEHTAERTSTVASERSVDSVATTPSIAAESGKNTPLSYRLQADFRGLSSRAQAATVQPDGIAKAGVPGFQNLSGRIEGTQAGGTLTLTSREATLAFPGVFAEPEILLATLEGKIHWKQQAGTNEIAIERLAFSNPDAAGNLSGSYRMTGQGPGIADLKGQLTRANALQVVRYFPLAAPMARAWVEHAVRGGRSEDVQFVLQGDLHQFPFADPKQGQFRVVIKVKDGTLAYLPGWPALEKVDGELVFERQGLHGLASAQVYGMAIGKTRFAIDDLRHHPILTLEGSAQGPLEDVVRYINNSPIADWSEQFTESMSVNGTSKLDLKLELPLLESAKTKIVSNLRFYGNDIVLERGMPVMARTQGQLIYDQHGLSLRNVSTNFLGGVLRLEGVPGADHATTIRVEGALTAQGLQRAYPSLFTKRMAGGTRYTGRITMHKRIPEIQLDSTLAGLSFNLPAPLRKQAGEVWPLHIESVPEIPLSTANNGVPVGKLIDRLAHRDEFRMTLGRDMRVRIQRERDTQGEMQIKRGVFSINEAGVLPAAGFAANINLRSFNLDEWRPVFAGEGESGNTHGAAGLDMLTLRSQEVQAYGKKIHNVTLGASHDGNAWQASVDADQLSGHFVWHPGEAGAVTGKLSARLARLSIPQSATGEVSNLLADAPEDIPALDIVAEDFTLAGKRLGQLELAAINTGTASNHVWRMQRLNISNPDATFNATGSWGREAFSGAPEAAKLRKTSLNFTLDVQNAGKLLERFGQKEALRNGAGKLEGEISWRGVPFTIDYASLNGKMQLAVDKGQFLKADPGIAKLLGVLSLQALPRRITLDFRDVFSDGFAFDTVRSNFDIANGVAATKDFKMKGVAATVLMEGTIDLARETQKLHLIVLPEISGGVASLAWGLLANPAVAAASFVAQLVLKDPIAKLFSYEYEVTGSWAEPNVVKIENKATPSENREGSSP